MLSVPSPPGPDRDDLIVIVSTESVCALSLPFEVRATVNMIGNRGNREVRVSAIISGFLGDVTKGGWLCREAYRTGYNLYRRFGSIPDWVARKPCQSESLDGSQIPPTLPINRSTGALVLRLLALGAPLLYLIFSFPASHSL